MKNKEEVIIGKYQVVKQVRNKPIFIGEDRISGNKVIMRQYPLDSNFDKAHIQNELLALKKIRHENVVSLLDVMEEGFKVYMIYEYYEGISLENYKNQKKRLKEYEIKSIMKQIVMGYKELIKSELLHKNITVQSILVRNGMIKIWDTGILKDWVKNEMYAAAEIVFGGEVFSVASDVWSIGAVMYFMINGTYFGNCWQSPSTLFLLQYSLVLQLPL